MLAKKGISNYIKKRQLTKAVIVGAAALFKQHLTLAENAFLCITSSPRISAQTIGALRMFQGFIIAVNLHYCYSL